MKKQITLIAFMMLVVTTFIPSCNQDNDNKPAETCSDGIKNQNEAGIDCGGVCTACPVIDIDSNVYHPITIGTQVWLLENLRTIHYRNGDPINNITDNSYWTTTHDGAWCFYNNDSTMNDAYGKLYNYYAVIDSRNIAPTGYHVPSDAELEILVNYLGGPNAAGGKLKEANLNHWISPNTGATNSSGFTLLPGGRRSPVDGVSNNLGTMACIWSTTPFGGPSSYSYQCTYTSAEAYRNIGTAAEGMSVRCIQD